MLATVFSLQVTVMSGYMLSRFKGATNKIWFTAIYLFRTVPYITWVMPLYLLTQSLGLYDTYLGLLLPHVAVHVCFFSWVMKGFFDGVEPELEQAAYLDGCSHWGAFLRIILPQARPGIMALGILCWLFTWNEFLFALILTGSRTPLLTVTMAQFVHELGVEWHLMSATAVMAMIPGAGGDALRAALRGVGAPAVTAGAVAGRADGAGDRRLARPRPGHRAQRLAGAGAAVAVNYREQAEAAEAVVREIEAQRRPGARGAGRHRRRGAGARDGRRA